MEPERNPLTWLWALFLLFLWGLLTLILLTTQSGGAENIYQLF